MISLRDRKIKKADISPSVQNLQKVKNSLTQILNQQWKTLMPSDKNQKEVQDIEKTLEDLITKTDQLSKTW